MKKTKFSVENVVSLWKSISSHGVLSPKNIVLKISKILGYNPISITLLVQQCNEEYIRSASIQAYYNLMEEEMLRDSLDLIVTS